MFNSILTNEIIKSLIHKSFLKCLCYCTVAKSCPALYDPMDCSTSGFPVFTIPWSLLKLMPIESVMPSNHLTLCCPILLLPSILTSIRVFSSELALLIRWPKYGSISFSISPSNKYSRLISFRIDWFDLLAVQGTLKSLLQHHNLKVKTLFFRAVLGSPQNLKNAV